ncbi:uncharacterized protein yc1106_02208 [Curvularia clavata]|uniref:Uncharacterized protein n=1 Tax=Curvularia clavata TaxID=95742 RepID=A0A9Q9DQQ2_CURCL|nr:uncharacterized protein yc1106_02208 [Curvularia clavata]
MLDAYQQHDAESIQEAIESTLHQVYSGYEIEVQDQAISTMLEVSGGDVDLLIAWIRSFTAAQDAGHNRCLHAISSIPEGDRLRRIRAVVAANVPALPATVARGVATREKPRRGPRSGESCSPPANKRARTTREIYGCPGEGGKCPKHKYAMWRSRASFLKHFVQDHVQEYKVGRSLQCLQCKGTESAHYKYPEQGQSLAIHIWEKHLSVQTESEAEMTALASEDGDETT